MQFAVPALQWPLPWRLTWPRVLQSALLAVLAMQGVRLAWLLIIWPSPVGDAPDAIATEAAPMATATGFDPFFSEVDAVRTTSGTSGLVLHGIRKGPAGSSAILGNAQGQQGSYRSGETVTAGVTLVDIASDHVVLHANGTRSRLAFQAASASVAAAPVAALPSAAPPAATNAAPGGLDPQQLLAQAGLQPQLENDRVIGYTLVPRGDGALLRQAGLQAGDMLLSVNGQALTPERYSALAEELNGASKIDITFRRGGDTRSISLQAKTP